jgi:hypothetical protein
LKDIPLTGSVAHHFWEILDQGDGSVSLEVGVVVSGWSAVFNRAILHDTYSQDLHRSVGQLKFRMERMYHL